MFYKDYFETIDLLTFRKSSKLNCPILLYTKEPGTWSLSGSNRIIGHLVSTKETEPKYDLSCYEKHPPVSLAWFVCDCLQINQQEIMTKATMCQYSKKKNSLSFIKVFKTFYSCVFFRRFWKGKLKISTSRVCDKHQCLFCLGLKQGKISKVAMDVTRKDL